MELISNIKIQDQRNKLSLVEKFFIYTGEIIAVRRWNSGNMYEIEVHLPDVDFTKWDKTMSLKCRISSFHYVDYTPSRWDCETRICNLYIDTSHGGRGSNWAMNQVEGSPFYYAKIESEKHNPEKGKDMVFIGDQTGVGHFSALYQLAEGNTLISGVLTFPDVYTAEECNLKCPWLTVETFSSINDANSRIEQWLCDHSMQLQHASFYIVGNAGLVVKARRVLKNLGIQGLQIRSKGFW